MRLLITSCIAFADLFFEAKVLHALADIEFSIQERCELLDVFYQVKRKF
ncbi:hypothetical protein M3Y14_04670 [Bacillus thuringiensis]|nr:hypothetical protein [Bacillus thuringiensis]UYX53447.1 hypothetical protein M3Y14_04670 [Bacillus thuringiensis]